MMLVKENHTLHYEYFFELSRDSFMLQKVVCEGSSRIMDVSLAVLY